MADRSRIHSIEVDIDVKEEVDIDVKEEVDNYRDRSITSCANSLSRDQSWG